jgi:hypothetical protein
MCCAGCVRRRNWKLHKIKNASLLNPKLPAEQVRVFTVAVYVCVFPSVRHDGRDGVAVYSLKLGIGGALGGGGPLVVGATSRPLYPREGA